MKNQSEDNSKLDKSLNRFLTMINVIHCLVIYVVIDRGKKKSKGKLHIPK